MFLSSHPIWGDTPAHVEEIPTNPANSDVSTADTLSIMCSLSRRDAGKPEIVSLATELSLGAKSSRQVLQSIWYWVHSHIKFKKHEEIVLDVFGPHHAGIESQLLISPADLLKLPLPQGDCAIFSTLTGALMVCCGIPTCLRATASDREEPYRWSHVYVVGAEDRGYEFPMDTSHGKYPGWETELRFRQMDYHI